MSAYFSKKRIKDKKMESIPVLGCIYSFMFCNRQIAENIVENIAENIAENISEKS